LAEAAEDSDGLGSSRVTTEHDWALVLKQRIHEPRVSGSVLGGYKNRGEFLVSGNLIFFHFLFPEVETEVLDVVSIVVEIVHHNATSKGN